MSHPGPQLSPRTHGTLEASWVWDVALGTVHVTSGWWQMLGYAEHAPDASPDVWNDWLHPQDRDEVGAIIAALLDREVESATAAFRLLRRDGSWLAVVAYCTPTLDAGGEVVLVRGVNHALTLAAPANDLVLEGLRQLAQVRAQLSSLSELAGIGYWETYPDGRPPYWCPVTYALVGTAREVAVQHTTFLDAVVPRDRARICALVLEAEAAGTPTRFKTELLGGHRGRRWVEVRGEPVYRGGALACFRGVMIDIDEEQRTYLALQQSEAQLKTLGVYIPGVVFEYERAPNAPDRLNASHGDLAALWGFQPADVRSDATVAWTRVHVDDVAPLQRALEASSANTSPLDVVFRYLHPTRGLRWQHLEARCHHEPGGRTLWRGFCRDITEQRVAAETLD